MKDNKYITESCPVCYGSGETDKLLPNSSISTMKHKCMNCKGIGKVPNQKGLDILNLVKAFGKKI